MSHCRHTVVLPELGMGDVSVVLSLWLVEEGGEVTEGDRLVEVLAGSASVDLPAPVSGRLVDILASEDDVLTPGQALGVIEELNEPN